MHNDIFSEIHTAIGLILLEYRGRKNTTYSIFDYSRNEMMDNQKYACYSCDDVTSAFDAYVRWSSCTTLSDDMLKTGSWSLYTSNFSPVLYKQKKHWISNKSSVQRMQIIVGLVNNLNKMEKIIEEHALCCKRLMTTSNDLQQVLDSYIKYPKDTVPPNNSHKCQR